MSIPPVSGYSTLTSNLPDCAKAEDQFGKTTTEIPVFTESLPSGYETHNSTQCVEIFLDACMHTQKLTSLSIATILAIAETQQRNEIQLSLKARKTLESICIHICLTKLIPPTSVLTTEFEPTHASTHSIALKSIQGRKNPSPDQHLRGIYSIAHAQALLLCDFSNELATGVLTLKVDTTRYVKFRHIRILRGSELISGTHSWVQIGTPADFFIHADDCIRELIGHNNREKYGPFSKIMEAMHAFQKHAGDCIQEIAIEDSPGKGKLTSEMDALGQLRAVTKIPIGEGHRKLVYENTIHWPYCGKLARAKLKKEVLAKAIHSEELEWEANFSTALEAAKVPHFVHAVINHGQDIRKSRLDMDLVKGGDFLQLIESQPTNSPEVRAKRLKYMLHIAEALSAIHAANLTHNDIKLENSYFNAISDEGTLGDFGLSAQVGKQTPAGSYPSPEYAGKPNQSVEAPASTLNDRWAFGIQLYEMLHGGSPYALGWKQGADAIRRRSQRLLVPLLMSSDQADRLIIELLSLNPRQRPTMEQVVQRLTKITKAMI